MTSSNQSEKCQPNTLITQNVLINSKKLANEDLSEEQQRQNLTSAPSSKTMMVDENERAIVCVCVYGCDNEY